MKRLPSPLYIRKDLVDLTAITVLKYVCVCVCVYKRGSRDGNLLMLLDTRISIRAPFK